VKIQPNNQDESPIDSINKYIKHKGKGNRSDNQLNEELKHGKGAAREDQGQINLEGSEMKRGTEREIVDMKESESKTKEKGNKQISRKKKLIVKTHLHNLAIDVFERAF
jgi:hypothetical protein